MPTAERKPRRNPAEIQGLHARLDRLRPSLTIRQIDGVGPIEVLWPVLSNKTLWTILSTGLSLLIPRDPPLAARWVAMLERAVRLENGTVLTGGLPAKRMQELHRALAAFAKLDLRPGVPKTGQDWGPLNSEVGTLEQQLGQLNARAPREAPADWWQPRLTRLARFYSGLRTPLTPRDVHNVTFTIPRSCHAAAVILAALAHGLDPKHLGRNLATYRKRLTKQDLS